MEFDRGNDPEPTAGRSDSGPFAIPSQASSLRAGGTVRRILVTGALGQIGSELVPQLRGRWGDEAVVASDVREPEAPTPGPFERVDCMRSEEIEAAVTRCDVGTVYHLAALLSAVAKQRPTAAWDLNMGGLYHALEVARQHRCAVFFPSSIGAFGPSTPARGAPQETLQRPTTIYGITKVSGELLCDYYHRRFDLDTRGLRLPGLISYSAPPGGGTTDYAVEMFLHALERGHYTCYLRPDTCLDMMYMPDALRAMIELMDADASRLRHRNAYNVAAMHFTPEELAEAIRVHVPRFEVDYQVDPARQDIADSWPDWMDDSAARAEWGWAPRYDLAATTRDMLERLDATLRAR